MSAGDGEGASSHACTTERCSGAEQWDQPSSSQINVPPSSLSNLSFHQFSIHDAPDDLPPAATIQILPNELLSNIFAFLDGPQPSTSVLHEEPSFNLTRAGATDLKAVSLVSKKWRQAILPVLFRHARFMVAGPEAHRPALRQMIQPFIDFANQGSLHKAIISFTLVIEDKNLAGNPAEPGRFDGFRDFWELLFDTIDPAELIVVAPVEALGALTSCRIYMEDAWTFDCPCHYLRLRKSPILSDSVLSADVTLHGKDISGSPDQEVKAPVEQEHLDSSSTPSEAAPLFRIRPWLSLLLNEGSFIKAYATYEFWQRQPPSVSILCLYLKLDSNII